jgi:putative transcriptional regulator
MPGMGDPRFAAALIVLCAHGPQGSMGLIVNRPAGGLRLGGLMKRIGLKARPHIASWPVHVGGPVEPERGFVLHGPDYDAGAGSLTVDGRFSMTATRDVLQALAGGSGPARALVALGYAGWGPGQLDSEIARNGWLTSAAEPDLIFDGDDAGKWTRALRAMGVDPLTLSSMAGRA